MDSLIVKNTQHKTVITIVYTPIYTDMYFETIAKFIICIKLFKKKLKSNM